MCEIFFSTAHFSGKVLTGLFVLGLREVLLTVWNSDSLPAACFLPNSFSFTGGGGINLGPISDWSGKGQGCGDLLQILPKTSECSNFRKPHVIWLSSAIKQKQWYSSSGYLWRLSEILNQWGIVSADAEWSSRHTKEVMTCPCSIWLKLVPYQSCYFGPHWFFLKSLKPLMLHENRSTLPLEDLFQQQSGFLRVLTVYTGY